MRYRDLVSFMKANASKPLWLAKVINAWEWGSLLPGGFGPKPSDAENVVDVLNASCGWRYILTKALFDEIGIESRAVNFYNVPFQSNHTTIELRIEGRWMLFDPTFGTYFEPAGGGNPLSAAEARAHWPDIVVKKSTLTGWQGELLDLRTVNPTTTYKTYKDSFFYQSEKFAGVADVISGEVNSLYFGPESAYRYGERRVAIPAGDRTWKTHIDSSDSYAWKRYVDSFDANRKLDSQWGVFDPTDSRYGWFIDWDQNHEHDWAVKKFYIGNAGNAVFNYSVTIYDDKSKVIVDYDTDPQQADWKVKTTYFSASGAPDREEGIFDNGRQWIIDWDQVGTASWSSYRDDMNPAGEVETTVFINDDGSTTIVDWAKINKIVGAAGNDVLNGGDGRDWLTALAGNDILSGGAGPDRMEGGMGNDIYYTDSPDDIVFERPNGGTDTVRASDTYVLPANVENLVLLAGVYGTGNRSDNFIFGNAGRNIISGGAGNDHLSGGGGKDKLVGGLGDDVIEGGYGADVLIGNAGRDTFVWRAAGETGLAAPTADVVLDFSARDGDKLHVKFMDANSAKSGHQAFAFIGKGSFTEPGQIRYVHAAGETRILLNTDSDHAYEAMIRLKGVVKPDASWFVL
ncbi:calcium-binding protein [Microvirga antarctica]|uniref:calcium-binding protein n=1 Tax=Microvirga antarctica TaxID=2819233 RepID=UPI001B301F06|nr:calcium-binding protein [Microvirga antarctica]